MIMCTFKRICVTNRHLSDRPLKEQIKRIFKESKPDMIILREKDLKEHSYAELASSINKICCQHNVEFVVNKYYDVAQKLGVGMQLSYETFMGLPNNMIDKFKITANIDNIKKDSIDLIPERTRVGVSVHSLLEAISAVKQGADYLIAGHIFVTDCKKGLSPRGPEFLGEICASVNIPVYAIGGINDDNISIVKALGAKGACQMSYYMKL